MEREELIAKATRISEIRQELLRMAALQEELRALEASLDAVTTGAKTGPVRRRRAGTSIEDRVFDFLVQHDTRDWDAEEVAGELHVKVPTTRAAFSKLRGAGKINDTSRGRVRAKRERETPKEEDVLHTMAA